MTATRIHVLLAGLMGAAGVALLAAAAHGGGTENLRSAGEMLLFHAAAMPGLTALRRAEALQMRLAHIAIALLILGPVLFAGDLAARVYLGSRLFPMAAPLGGGLTILGWLIAAASGLFGSRASPR